jgi:phage shock protein PspC (stress-responsive transcriptional regulator)
MQPNNLFFRDDTILGVCEALGEDFRFNPIYLRVALSVALIWNPAVIIGGYLAAGVVIAVSRLLSPNPRVTAPAEEAQPALAAPQAQVLADNETEALAVAA